MLVVAGVVGGLPIPHPSYAQTVVSQGLLAHWTFDQGTIQGNQVQDTSNQNRHGTNVGATQVGNCLSFDGKDDRVIVPNFDRQTFSYTSWVQKLDGGKGYPALMTSENSFGWGIGYLKGIGSRTINDSFPSNVASNGPGRVYLSNSDGATYRYSEADIAPNAFHHIAVTYDSKQIAFYIDGILDSIQAYSQTFNGNGGPYLLGYRLTKPINPTHPYESAFRGLMDDVRLYDRTLAASEVAQIAAQGPNCSAAVTTPTPSATPTPESKHKELDVEKTDGRTKVKPGQQFSYTITVENKGEVDIHDLRVADTLPNSVEVVAVFPHTSFNRSSQVITWEGRTLGIGAKEKFTITVRVKDNVVSGTRLINEVRAESKDHSLEDTDRDDDTNVEREVVKAAVLVKPQAIPVTAKTGAGGSLALVTTLLGSSGLLYSLRRLTK